MFDPLSALHKDYPLVCRWFISLARRDQFTSAVWKASDDVGFDAFRDFVQGTRKTQVVAPGKIGEEAVPQTNGKGQKVHVKSSKAATGSKSSSQQVPKKATTSATESIVSLCILSPSLTLFLPLSLPLSLPPLPLFLSLPLSLLSSQIPIFSLHPL